MAKKSSDIETVPYAQSVAVVATPATVCLKNKTKQHLVFNLPHAQFCGDESPCACETQTRLIEEYNHRTEEHTPKVVDRLVCSSVGWLAGEKQDVDIRVLKVSNITRAISRGDLVKC